MRMFDLRESAFLCNCHVNTLKNAIKRGELKAYQEKPGRGNPWKITPEDLCMFMIKRQKEGRSCRD